MGKFDDHSGKTENLPTDKQLISILTSKHLKQNKYGIQM